MSKVEFSLDDLDRVRRLAQRFHEQAPAVQINLRAIEVDTFLQQDVESIAHLTKRCATCGHLGDLHVQPSKYHVRGGDSTPVVWAPHCRDQACPCTVFVFPNGEPVTGITAGDDEGATS